MKRLVAALGLAAVSTWAAAAQQRPVPDPQKYDLWQRPGMPTTDDPRRIPVKEASTGDGVVRALRGGRLIDGNGGASIEDAVVVMTGNRITAAGPAAKVSVPAGATVFDVTGSTILPGLIDLHTHLSYHESPLAAYTDTEAVATIRAIEKIGLYLRSGITSLRDVASRGDVAFALKDWVRQGRLAGPRIFPAGKLITGTGGHGAERGSIGTALVDHGEIREANGPDDFRRAVREQIKAGADYIKLGSNFTREEVAAAVDEAHQLGIRVTADAHTYFIQWAVEAGIDCIEHPLPRDDETIRLMKARGTYAVPTLVPYINIFDQSGGYFGSVSRRFSFSKEDNFKMLQRLKAAGITMGIGTDLIYDWYQKLPEPYLIELKQFVAAGFTPMQAIQAATRNGAEILGMLDKVGTIETGKLADVLVVDGDPIADIEALRRVRYVFVDGRPVVARPAVPQISRR